jgi:putative SOS response-associated peptidase YedK
MCYSAMVIQDAKKYGVRFEARVQYDAYLDIFSRRLDGEKLTINRAMEAQFTKSPSSAVEKKIAKSIIDWHENEKMRLEQEIFKQKERLANAERTLKTKTTKKAQEDLRIATKKIDKCKSDLKKHDVKDSNAESERRIFPFHFVSMLVTDENGEKVVRPFRYHMRPHDKDEGFDREFMGCYNARFNNLKRVEFWKDSLAKSRRGIILVERFFENVAPKEYAKKHKLPKEMKDLENLVLCFEPDNKELMIIPTLWDVWKKRGESPLYSTALITDEPLPEIAQAGHDRTPIFLKESAVDLWLSAETAEEAIAALGERERPHYNHRLMGAA